jgi:hypothetical protein
MLRVAGVLAIAMGLVLFFTVKRTIGPAFGAAAYTDPQTRLGMWTEHDWLRGTAYFVAFGVLGCLSFGLAELVRGLSATSDS